LDKPAPATEPARVSLAPSPPPVQPAYSPARTSFKGSDKMSASVIGADLQVTGSLVSKGEVTVEGEIQGDINCASLLVGDTARIMGNVVSEDVVVRGRVEGSIRGARVTLQSSSHVEGDIFHKSLAIEQGAFFEGKSRRSEDPVGTAPKTDSALANGAVDNATSFGAQFGTN
jgi:cytoskeletal protein CcmA (bactofilin family)